MKYTTSLKAIASLRRAAVLALAAAGLAGCVYYPSGYGRGSGYYAPAVTVAPPPIVFGGWWGDDDD
ncbi:MAG: hypothetical protein KGQ79_04530 [Proteobacteria bacterium]|nr:hypothetical protein [Pseudomonadota bacterium]MBU6425001.1 hypothetical protein [Rhodospirillales bacterium]